MSGIVDADRTLPWSDHAVWTEHDLVGAVDDRYRSFTVGGLES
jgi:hypothetical protein